MSFIAFIKQRHIWFVVVLVAADLLFFSTTNPSNLPSVALILGFVLLSLSLYQLLRLVIYILSLYGLPTSRHGIRIAGALTTLCMGFLALQSIGELTIRDALVLTPLAIILYAYLVLMKRDRRRES